MISIDGIINFLKPSGMTSHDAVSFLRRLCGIKRIGHTGSLDPMAVGVLPLCIGSAARIAEYLTADEKNYRCEMKLGLRTDTQDIWGTAPSGYEDGIGDLTGGLTEEAVRKAIESFTGRQLQLPPAYSAVKIKGRKLYEYARAGESVKAEPREVNIKKITVNHIDLTRGLVRMDVDCSKGTYIRTLCNDIGELLGCGAVMSALVRTASGYFKISDALTVEELEKGIIADVLIPADVPLCGFESVHISGRDVFRFVNGVPVRLGERSEEFCRVYAYRIGSTGVQTEIFLGIGKVKDGFLKADKVLISDEVRAIIMTAGETTYDRI